VRARVLTSLFHVVTVDYLIAVLGIGRLDHLGVISPATELKPESHFGDIGRNSLSASPERGG
jgi:hypothetical protein